MGQFGLHLRAWEHGNILNAQWLKDLLLEIVIERETGRALHANASPVDTDLVPDLDRYDFTRMVSYAVFPALAGLMHKRLNQILEMTREFIVPNGFAMIAKTLVKESVPKAS